MTRRFPPAGGLSNAKSSSGRGRVEAGGGRSKVSQSIPLSPSNETAAGGGSDAVRRRLSKRSSLSFTCGRVQNLRPVPPADFLEKLQFGICVAYSKLGQAVIRERSVFAQAFTQRRQHVVSETRRAEREAVSGLGGSVSFYMLGKKRGVGHRNPDVYLTRLVWF